VITGEKIQFGEETNTLEFIQRSSMTWMGNLSLMVNLLRVWKFGHMCQEPSFFRTITTGEEYGLVLMKITPTSNNSCTFFSISFFWEEGYLHGHTLGEWLPRRRGILCVEITKTIERGRWISCYYA
jgi:hypothetical protein